MRVWQRRGVEPGGDQAGEMGHIHQQIGADLVGDGADPGEVDDARIGRAAGNDHFRPLGPGQALQFLVIEKPIIPAHAVLDGAEPLAGKVGRGAVGQMAAGGERHP